MSTLTFKQYLIEQAEVDQTDPEDLSPDDMEKRAMELRRQAQLKRTNPEMAKRKAMMALRQKLRAASDPRQKADIQRRITALMKGNSEDQGTGI